MGASDRPTTDVIAEAETYEQRAQESPETVVSDLPRLVELLERNRTDGQGVALRKSVLRAIYCITRQNPDELGDRYPEIIEQTLDTPESKVIAKRILHRGTTLVSDGMPPELICETLDNGLDEAIEDLYESENVPGHGATAMHFYQQVDDYAEVMTGRRRLVMEALTDAFSGLVKYRASQRGIDPIDGFVDLRAEYVAKENPEKCTLGFGPNGSIVDMVERGEVYSKTYAHWYLLNGCIAAMLVLLVERTEPRILRTEAVIADRIH
jgi:hypothetical protein